jgi:hypothetical protein
VVADIVIESLLILLRREAVASNPAANGDLRGDVIEVDVGNDITEELARYADGGISSDITLVGDPRPYFDAEIE